MDRTPQNIRVIEKERVFARVDADQYCEQLSDILGTSELRVAYNRTIMNYMARASQIRMTHDAEWSVTEQTIDLRIYDCYYFDARKLLYRKTDRIQVTIEMIKMVTNLQAR